MNRQDQLDAQERALLQRRRRHLAGSMLFYDEPLHIVRGEGVNLYDSRGRRYLDCYNNVQSMGHSNPEITAAIAEQTGRLTTHTRYLHEAVVELAEEAAATLPDPLDVCLFTCTGTEACELAMRIARVVTGNSGIVVMEGSYHGNSKLVGEMSTTMYPADERPPWIEAVEPPNTFRGPFREGEDDPGARYAGLLEPAIAALEHRGEGLSAFVCDAIFDSNGAFAAPDNYFAEAYRRVRQAGGLCVADEVQAGVCRTGAHFWGFQHHDVVPDIVFTGKPFGGGYPVAAVFTTREIAARWAEQDYYFNTFGGNPVAAAAALAVVRIARQADMAAHAHRVGGYLFQGLERLAARYPVMGRVQGRGLFIGVDLVTDPDTRSPATALAARLSDAMKEEGVLIGHTGRFGNCLKFRPPLVFDQGHADEVLGALRRVLQRYC